MTPNCANTILNMGRRQEFPLQGKDFRNSRRLSKVVPISTNLFLVLGRTPNCANTISNMGRGQEFPLQGKDFRNSQRLSNVVPIYKTNKLVLSKKYMSLKTRSSEKVPHSKGSCSRLIFCNQLIKYSVFLVLL